MTTNLDKQRRLFVRDLLADMKAPAQRHEVHALINIAANGMIPGVNIDQALKAVLREYPHLRAKVIGSEPRKWADKRPRTAKLDMIKFD